ncbi:hypothetical protein D3C77_572000 [compost metagenome]
MLALPDSLTGNTVFSRFGFWLSISDWVFALVYAGSETSAFSPRLSASTPSTALTFLGFLASGLTVGCSSGISGAPSHSALLNCRSTLKMMFCNFTISHTNR